MPLSKRDYMSGGTDHPYICTCYFHANDGRERSPNELTSEIAASTFMILALRLAENPKATTSEELQAIYAYTTEAEYGEVLSCYEELIYCTIFIASYSSGVVPYLREAPNATEAEVMDKPKSWLR